jgi:hypothetical protein
VLLRITRRALSTDNCWCLVARRKGVIRVIRVWCYLRGLCAALARLAGFRPAPPLYQLGGVSVDTRPTCLTLSQPVSCIIDSRRYRVAYIIDCLAGIVDPLDIRPHLVGTYSSSLQSKSPSSKRSRSLSCTKPSCSDPLVVLIHLFVPNSTHQNQNTKLQWLPMVPQQWIPQQCSKRSSYPSDRSSRNTLSFLHQWTPSMAV